MRKWRTRFRKWLFRRICGTFDAEIRDWQMAVQEAADWRLRQELANAHRAYRHESPEEAWRRHEQTMEILHANGALIKQEESQCR